MQIAAALDRNHLELGCCMLASLAENGGETCHAVHVFADRLSRNDRAVLRRSYRHDNLTLHSLAREYRRKLIGLATSAGHLSTMTYFRILLPEALRDQGGKLLYLDNDLILNANVRTLFDEGMDGHAVAAVEARALGMRPERNSRLGNPPDTPYFNAGVLMIDLDRWRETGVSDAAFRFARDNPEKLRDSDQDTLNAVLCGNWKALDAMWNLHTQSKYAGSLTRQTCLDARIIHFIGKIKPNHTDCKHPAQDMFLAYRDLTPWKDKPLTTPRERRKANRRNRAVGQGRRWWIEALDFVRRGWPLKYWQ